jgi:hypothetical protein
MSPSRRSTRELARARSSGRKAQQPANAETATKRRHQWTPQ